VDHGKQAQMLALFGEYSAETPGLDFEARRNHENFDVFEAMIREAYPDTTMAVCGHHIMYMRAGHKLPYEIASADTLIFDHDIAQRIWKDRCEEVLQRLAIEPPSNRDAVLREIYSARGGQG
jgi:hypothetical protein